MLKSADANGVIEFESTFDTGEPKTIFVLKPLSGVEMLSMGDIADTDKASSLIRLLSSSIVEIRNFDGDQDKETIIRSLDTQVLNELLEKVNEVNHITEVERKN